MKIICVDNFDGDYVDDKLVAENVSEFYGKIIVDFLIREHTSETGMNYYRLVEDDYKLNIFEP